MSQLDKWMNSSEFCNISESEMLKHMFQEDYKFKKVKYPKIENTDKGLVIKSILYRNINWLHTYIDSDIFIPWTVKISHVNKTEIIMFKPGYELLYKLID